MDDPMHAGAPFIPSLPPLRSRTSGPPAIRSAHTARQLKKQQAIRRGGGIRAENRKQDARDGPRPLHWGELKSNFRVCARIAALESAAPPT